MSIPFQVGKEGAVASQSYTAPPPAAPDQKPVHDVMAGAMARAASQGTIHPLDTLKVQMQVGKQVQQTGRLFMDSAGMHVSAGQFDPHYKDTTLCMEGSCTRWWPCRRECQECRPWVRQHKPRGATLCRWTGRARRSHTDSRHAAPPGRAAQSVQGRVRGGHWCRHHHRHLLRLLQHHQERAAQTHFLA